MFLMPEIITIKLGRGHPKNFTNLYTLTNAQFELKSLYSPNCINDFEVLAASVDFNELFVSKGTEARGTGKL